MKKTYLILNCLFIFSAAILAQNPYASYPLDGNANDISGNNLNGTITGSPVSTTNRFNEPGKALLFNGSTDYIDLPSPFDFPNRTVIVWYYPTKFGSANGENVVYVSDNPNIQNGLTAVLAYINSLNDNVGLTIADQIHTYACIDSNHWYQAAVVRTPEYMKTYSNGALMCTRYAPDGTHSTNLPASPNAVVGADRGYAAKFYGKIDDLKIYNVAVEDSIIAMDYSTGQPCYATDLATVEQERKEVSISPNPATGDISVKLNGDYNEKMRFNIVSAEGQSIRSGNASRQFTISTNQLSNGIYFLIVKDDKSSYTVNKFEVIH